MTILLTILAQAEAASGKDSAPADSSTSKKGDSGEPGSKKEAPEGGFDTSMLVMMGVIFVVFIYFSSRSNKRRMKEHQKKIESAQKGDKVELQSGMIGVIDKVDSENKEVRVIIDEEKNVRAIFNIGAIKDLIVTEKVSVKKDSEDSSGSKPEKKEDNKAEKKAEKKSNKEYK